MKKVIVVTTGGSIAFKRNAATGAIVPIDGEDMLAQLLNSGIATEFSEFSSLPGSHITPAQGLELARQIDALWTTRQCLASSSRMEPIRWKRRHISSI